jgi:Tol biopolymer transport system component
MAFASDRAGGTAQDMYFSARPDKSSPWSPPVLIPLVNSTANDWDAFLGDHALQIFFNSDRAGMAGDLYFATRTSSAATFGPVLPLTELNSPANDTDPTLSRDLRYIMFGSNRSGDPEIYEAHR